MKRDNKIFQFKQNVKSSRFGTKKLTKNKNKTMRNKKKRQNKTFQFKQNVKSS